MGITYVSTIELTTVNSNVMTQVQSDITNLLRTRHQIQTGQDNDFSVENSQDILKTMESTTSTLTLFLGSIAAISLVVGGIGIMNIMLVSVSERTREIGLRKALGATNKDILTQFLYESVMLTALGGVIGIILGASISFLASLALSAYVAEGWTFTFPISAALLGLGVSGAIGLMFGIYPAKRAAEKSPMEALRYE